MTAIYKKELRSYFISPIGYIFVASFLMVSSLIFVYTNLYQGTTNVTSYFQILLFLFSALFPILTMRMFSEEKKSKTEQILLTSPVSLPAIICAKFFAAYTLFAGTFLLSCLNFIALFRDNSSPNMAIVAAGIFEILLIGAVFVALGIFVSACTENQFVSAILTILGIVAFLAISIVSRYVPVTFLREAMNWVSVFGRFDSASKGQLDFASLIYYVSLTVIFLFLTVRVFEKRRWE